MLNNLRWPRWPKVSFAVAATLALVVIYDVLYVWRIHGRMSVLTDRCAVLGRSLGSVLDKLAKCLEMSASQGRADVSRLSERLGQLERVIESRSDEQAAEKGEEASRLISCVRLTKARPIS